MTIEEVLQHRTYQDAIVGSRSSRQEVLKMIAKREKWLAEKSRKHFHPVETPVEPSDPDNAEEALPVLGIAELDERWRETRGGGRRLLLCPWTVQLALRRCRRRLSAKDIDSVKRCMRGSDTLRWPAGTIDEHRLRFWLRHASRLGADAP